MKGHSFCIKHEETNSKICVYIYIHTSEIVNLLDSLEKIKDNLYNITKTKLLDTNKKVVM